MSALRICRGCGCTDDRACPGGYEWVLMDFEIHGNRVRPIPSGICSTCAAEFDWDWELMASVIDGSAAATAEERQILQLRW